jgi:hypothetical protein
MALSLPLGRVRWAKKSPSQMGLPSEQKLLGQRKTWSLAHLDSVAPRLFGLGKFLGQRFLRGFKVVRRFAPVPHGFDPPSRVCGRARTRAYINLRKTHVLGAIGVNSMKKT